MKRHAKLWERPDHIKYRETIRWIPANERFDSVRLTTFKVLDRSQASVDKLSDRDYADSVDLLHL
jgi:hypothetical protein